MNKSSIFIFAGESSGDLHGEKLLLQFQRELSKARIWGVGGPRMRWAGLECILPMEQFQVMGFVDVFFAFPKIMRNFFFLRSRILKEKPDLVLLIDYPGFNLALAKSLKKKGYKGKICQYICPSVWAWGKKRIPKMEKIFDHLFVTFPFEKDLFDKRKLKVEYVGHPLVHEISHSPPPIDIDPEYRVLALFPGSRKKELIRNFPKQIRVLKKLLQEYPDLFLVISVADPSFSLLLDQLMKMEGISHSKRMMFIHATQNQALMRRATLAIAKSGTINLELALQKVPTIVTYEIGKADLFIAKNLLRIDLPHYCIVNILAGKRIYPELYGPNFTEEALYKQVKNFLSEEKTIRECGEKCSEIDKILANKYPEEEITQRVKQILNEKRPTEDLHRSSQG